MKKLSQVLRRSIPLAIVTILVFGCQTTGKMKSDQGNTKYAHPEALASTDWLQAHLKDENIRVVDCTVSFINPDSYKKGHIPGAVSLDVIRQLSDPKGRVPLLILPKRQFEDLMGKLGIDHEKNVVVYDAFGGSWAARLWWALRYYGHDNVKILNGGLKKWKAEGRQLETSAPVSLATVFKTKIQSGLIAGIKDVEQAIKKENIYLVDALTADHHFGRKPFHPSLAPPGHIPTSINIPGPSNIDPGTGLFLLPAALKEHWSSLKADSQDKVIVYCGAGYFGAFDLFALYQLGHKTISLYDGSWMEWISDETRTIATK